MIGKFLIVNVVPTAELRSFLGKAMNVASVIFVWRPFLAEIWAAMTAAKETNAPANCVWTQQIRHSLKWLMCFLCGVQGALVRDFTFEAYSRTGKMVTIQTDASPFGIGAVLYIDGKASECLLDAICDHDELHLGYKACRGCVHVSWPLR